MSELRKKSKEKLNDAKKTQSKSIPLDDAKRDSPKEKIYSVKQIETSLKLLESIEDEIVLDALLFLSKYGDLHQENNLNYLQILGIIPLLLKLLDRNVCIQRLSLRLVDLILRKTAHGIHEIDQDIHGNDILKISHSYIENEDQYIKNFTVRILETLAKTTQAKLLVYNIDLLSPIFRNLHVLDDDSSIEVTLNLFNSLTDEPAVLAALAEPQFFDLEMILELMRRFEIGITDTILNILGKITNNNIAAIQKRLQEVQIMEQMMDIILDNDREVHHAKVLYIMDNCMDSEYTNSYFTNSRQFLKFSLWSRSCSDEYILRAASIFEKLSGISSMRQRIFDLGVHETMLFFFRSDDKEVLNKACYTVANMSTHKYCCEKILVPVVVKKIFSMLLKDDSDNEVALETVHEFCMRSHTMIEMLFEYNGISEVLRYLDKNLTLLNHYRVLEILNVCVGNKKNFFSESFYNKIIDKLKEYHDDGIWIRVVEILMQYLDEQHFRQCLLESGIISLLVQKVRDTKNENLLKFLLAFVFNSLLYKTITLKYISEKLHEALQEKSDLVKEKLPIINRVNTTLFQLYLPLKFFETGKLEITDRIRERFHIIDGEWSHSFPFIEILEHLKLSTRLTFYVVHCYPFELPQQLEDSIQDESLRSSLVSSISSYSESPQKVLSKKDFAEALKDEHLLSTASINYGRLSHDPFLLHYIYYLRKKFKGVTDIKMIIQEIAKFVDSQLAGIKDWNSSTTAKIHEHKLHLESVRIKLGTNLIPIGYMRIGFHCERALLFKALSDACLIPSSLHKGAMNIYWNEVILIHEDNKANYVKFYIVDLMNNIGFLHPKGSREANMYCNIK